MVRLPPPVQPLTVKVCPPVVSVRLTVPTFARVSDVEADVNSLDNVYVYDVDDLQKVLAENAALRADAAAQAEALVAEDVARFVRARALRDAVPVLAQLRARAEAIRKAELERALANLPTPLTEAQAAVVTAMTTAIVNKVLHQPSVKLRSVPLGESVNPLAEAVAVRELAVTGTSLSVSLQVTIDPSSPSTVPWPE